MLPFVVMVLLFGAALVIILKLALYLCFMVPFRAVFGFLMLAAAVAFFLFASYEKQGRLMVHRAELMARHSLEQEQAEIDAERRKHTVSNAAGSAGHSKLSDAAKAAPVPSPPQPSSDGASHAVAQITTASQSTSDTASTRSAWVNQAPHFDSRGGKKVYVANVTAGPFPTQGECDLALAPEIDRAATDFAEHEFPQAAEGSVKLDSLVNTEMVQNRQFETVNTSFGSQQIEHAQLQFDSKVIAEIQRQWRTVVVAQRLQAVAIGSCAVLMLLGGAYSLLRRRPRAVQVA